MNHTMGDKAIPDRASTTTSPFPFFPNFHLDFPNPFRRETQQPRRQIVASDDPTPAAAAADKPDAIKFAERKPSSTAPPLQLEVDEPSHPLLTYSLSERSGSMAVTGKDQQDTETPNPVIVRLPNARPVAPSMEVQASESTSKSHNPVIIWQVYALGGFIVLKWVWARWNERKERANKGSSTEENRSPEYHSPAEGED